MAFILSAQREVDCDSAFARYRDYLASEAANFPKSAYALATSDWYYSFENRAPHDARLVTCEIAEKADFTITASPSIRLRLLGACGDGFIQFEYPEVLRYDLAYTGGTVGHQDWRYDEFRLANGRLIHEIEWSGAGATGTWIIEALDVLYTWIPSEAPR